MKKVVELLMSALLILFVVLFLNVGNKNETETDLSKYSETPTVEDDKNDDELNRETKESTTDETELVRKLPGKSFKYMSAEECYNALIEAGVGLEPLFTDKYEYVQKLVNHVIKYPDATHFFNYTESQRVAMEIREVVLENESIETSTEE